MTSKLLSFLDDLLTMAGAEALRAMDDLHVDQKSDGSLVTDLDRSIERLLVTALRKEFPTAGIIGEEGADRAGSGQQIYIDPIDGTEVLVRGMAYWGPAISVVEDGELVAGAFYLPVLGKMYTAARGEGAFENGRRLQLVDHNRGDNASMFVSSRFHQAPSSWWTGKTRSLGSTAAHLALVACGTADAAFVPGWSFWDVGCGALMIREAGGVVLGLDGHEADLVHTPDLPFVAGAPTACRRMVAAVAASKE